MSCSQAYGWAVSGSTLGRGGPASHSIIPMVQQADDWVLHLAVGNQGPGPDLHCHFSHPHCPQWSTAGLRRSPNGISFLYHAKEVMDFQGTIGTYMIIEHLSGGDSPRMGLLVLLGNSGR